MRFTGVPKVPTKGLDGGVFLSPFLRVGEAQVHHEDMMGLQSEGKLAGVLKKVAVTGVLPNEGRKELGWRKRKLWCGSQSEGCEAAGACITEHFGAEASWGTNRGAKRDPRG